MAVHPTPSRPDGRVFLSYRHQDAALARALERQATEGLELYSYPYDRAPTHRDWREVVTELMEEANALVCIVGPTTGSSGNVEWELREAATRKIPIFLVGPGASTLAADHQDVTIIKGESPEEILAALRSSL
jgi:TIR domain